MKYFLFSILFSFNVWATPDKTEVWFLSYSTTSLKVHGIELSSKLLVQNNCIPMGDGCFHPQEGYVGQKDFKDNDEDLPTELKTFNAQEAQLVNCEKDYYFDVFCGKAKKEGPAANMEVWVDTSSSMRNVDYSVEVDYCHRRNFVDALRKKCKKDVPIAVFNTSKKSLGQSSDLCRNYGNNSLSQLKKWVKTSNAKKLIIITDIDEMNLEFKNFIDEIGASYQGVGATPFYAKNLNDQISSLVSHCQ